MADLFFYLVAGLFTAYVVLDGFDLGAGALHLFIAETDAERREVLASIGPFWDGNEVWLLAAGGTMLLAFPRALGAALSGFYLAVFFLLWSLMLRGLSIELRSHVKDELWRAFWDFLLTVSSALVIVLLGAALGNVVRGVPIGDDGNFTLSLFTTLSPHGAVGLLDWYTLLVGAFALASLVAHGAAFVAYKTTGAVHERAHRHARIWSFGSALGWPVVFFLSLRVAPSAMPNAAWVMAVLAALSLAARSALLQRSRHREAFIASCAFLTLTLLGIAVARAPVLLTSTDGRHDIVAQATAAAPASLATALRWWVFAVVLAIGYLANLFRIHRGKAVVPDEE